MSTCPYKSLCVVCLGTPRCSDWFPMRPGMTLRKWRNWLRRAESKDSAD